ncbi:MAG: hypothetical protein H6744_05590 [Deltaproteobacteria bacterium]|nr:hypothetical protein [Deltaproteobacteria bacterium]MCB9786152.1 hypothetical protein [Deltaproteobacteria bacterium]
MMRCISLVTLGLSVLSLAACGDDEVSSADAARYCKALCEKTKECAPSGLPVSIDCDAQCRDTTGGGSGTGSCNATKSQVDACISAYQSATCAEIQSGNTPSACDICNEDTPDATGDSTGTPDTSLPDSSGGGATCSDLSDCCDQITDASQKLGCQQTVSLGADSTCATVLAGFKANGSCN